MSLSGVDLLGANLSANLPSDAEQEFSVERERGNAAYREGRLDAAIDHYTKAETINPLSPLPPANRSMVYLKLRRWQNAREEATVAIELQNALPVDLRSESLTIKLFLRRATACKNLMLFPLAADDYKSVLRVDPNNADAKKGLEELRQELPVAPSRSLNPLGTVSSSGAKRSTNRDFVRVIGESNGHANGSTNFQVPSRASMKSAVNDAMQDEVPLLSLPTDTARHLTSQWSNVPPESNSQFEHVWRALHNDPSAQARYLLLTVGSSRVRGGLMGDELTPKMLEDIPRVLTIALKENIVAHEKIADMLLAFSDTSRFSLLMMFLSSDDRASFIKIINNLSDLGVSPTLIRKLKELYG